MPNDIDNYDYSSIPLTATIPLTVKKAIQDYTLPALNATYGDTLASIDLPAGWVWEDNTGLVGNAGIQVHEAKFIPLDTNNYDIQTDINISVNVARKPISPPTAAVSLVYNSVEQTAVTSVQAIPSRMVRPPMREHILQR